MSELSSLYARINIKAENYNKFLSDRPKQPRLDDNWTNWWSSRKMYGKRILEADDLYAYNDASNKEILDGWKNASHSGTLYEYDAATQTMKIGIVFFSENYGEMIPMLAFLLSLADYKEYNDDDFIIIYPYFWGDKVLNAFITFAGKDALFDIQKDSITDVASEKLNEAAEYLVRIAGELSAQYED